MYSAPYFLLNSRLPCFVILLKIVIIYNSSIMRLINETKEVLDLW